MVKLATNVEPTENCSEQISFAFRVVNRRTDLGIASTR